LVCELRFREDFLLFRDWFLAILMEHCLEALWDVERVKPRIDMHVTTLDRREIDVVVSCRGRRICIELKEANMEKAIKQAIGYLDSGSCDYAYVAIDAHVYTVLDYVRTKPELIKEAINRGIGIVAARDKVIVFRAFKRKDAARKYANLLELVKRVEGG